MGRLGDVDQRMAEVVVVQQGSARECGLEIGKPQASKDASPNRRHCGSLVFIVDKFDEARFVEFDKLFTSRRVKEIIFFTQYVIGDMGNALNQAHQAELATIAVLVI